LYRQAVINNRQGVDYNRSTMGRGIGLCSALIRPLVDAAQAYVMQAGKVHADDTTLPVLAPGNGKTRTGRLWAYVRDDRNSGGADAPAVWFAYSPDRQGRHPQEHLKQFKGVLQVDAYAGYHPLFVDGQIREVACMAHARRKIHDLHVRRPTALTTQALNRIGVLYAIEAEIRGQLPEVRLRMRQERSRPLLDDFGLWLREKLLTLSAQSDTAKAINYFINQWDALIYYCDDGLSEIDNNIAENALRAVTLGRKNFLFAGSDSGGARAASMYSLIGTCKLNSIDPQAYLKHVLTHIGDHPVNRVHELLPWNVPGLRPPP
jgi:transposase